MSFKNYSIGIDFGTSRSGISWTEIPEDKKTNLNIFPRSVWKGDSGGNVKTLSQIILDKNNKVVDFGFTTNQHMFDNPDEELYLFSGYKLALFDRENKPQLIRSNLSCGPKDFKEVQAEVLITQTLIFLKNEMLKDMKEHLGKEIPPESVLWVVTVPAIWDNYAKQTMRKCSISAGLIKEDDNESLILAYEPEAGALECIKSQQSYTIESGNKILVADIGGGTADFIGFEKHNDLLHSISKPFGSNWGSNYVNENFISFLKKLLGDDEIKKANGTSDYFTLLEKIEVFKKSVDLTSESKGLPLNPNIFNQKSDWLLDKIKIYNVKYKTTISFNRNVLQLPKIVWLEFFTPLFNNITDCIKKEISENKKMEKLDYLFFIGGFTNNELLRAHIEKELRSVGCKFIIPQRPSLAVVNGATRYGLNQSIIADRIHPYTVGTRIGVKVAENENDKKKLIEYYDGVPHCTNKFQTFAKNGDKIGNNDEVIKYHIPLTNTQEIIVTDIYISKSKNIEYVTDPDVEYIGEIRTAVDFSVPLAQRKKEIKMKFGLTEPLVTVTCLTTGKVVKSDFNFIPNSEAETLRRRRIYEERYKSVLEEQKN